MCCTNCKKYSDLYLKCTNKTSKYFRQHVNSDMTCNKFDSIFAKEFPQEEEPNIVAHSVYNCGICGESIHDCDCEGDYTGLYSFDI